jgi:preprotein translocase subunit SecD
VALAFLAYFTYKPILNHINLGLDLKGGLHVVLQAQEKPGQKISSDTISKSIGVLRNRIDQLGVREPIIYPQGEDRIVIELAGVKDPEEAVNIIKNTAQLEFWDENNKVLLTGEHLKDAQAEVTTSGGTSGAKVNIEFDSEGAKLFSDATAANLNKPIKIVLDKTVISAPTVSAHITDGKAEITGSFTAEEANNLAVLLRSGALPVSFGIMEKRTVGPTLGADSLSLSVKASIIGLIAILIFMLGYYRLPGIVADISMVLYSVLVLGVMAMIGSVLTFRHSGFILSIGMAVDANIIIYEHVKEELRFGKTLRQPLKQDLREPLDIFDSN